MTREADFPVAVRGLAMNDPFVHAGIVSAVKNGTPAMDAMATMVVGLSRKCEDLVDRLMREESRRPLYAVDMESGKVTLAKGDAESLAAYKTALAMAKPLLLRGTLAAPDAVMNENEAVAQRQRDMQALRAILALDC